MSETTAPATVLVSLDRLAPSQQVREKIGDEAEHETRLRIDELERSMWIDLARGLPFWSTLVVQAVGGVSGPQPRYSIVDGERRYRALLRLRRNLERELASDEWDGEQKENIRRNISSRDS